MPTGKAAAPKCIRFHLTLEASGNRIHEFLSNDPEVTVAYPALAEVLRAAGFRRVSLGPFLGDQVMSVTPPGMEPLVVPFAQRELQEGTDVATLERRVRKRWLAAPRTLRAHQTALCRHFAAHEWRRDSLQRPFWMVWNTGAGKTAGVLEATLGSAHVPRRLLVVAANKVLAQFAAEVRNTVLGGQAAAAPATPATEAAAVAEDVAPPRHEAFVMLLGYTEFERNGLDAAPHAEVVVLDEAHHYKNLKPAMVTPVLRLSGVRNLLALTATPLMNGPDDLRGMLALHGEAIEDAGEAGETGTRWGELLIPAGSPPEAWDPPRLLQLFRNHLSYYSIEKHAYIDAAAHLPRREFHVLPFTMSIPHVLFYMAHRGMVAAPDPRPGREGRSIEVATHHPNAYGTGEVLALKEYDEGAGCVPAIQVVLQLLLQESTAFPVLVYSDYVEKGLLPLRQAVTTASSSRGLNWRLGDITGKSGADAVAATLAAYNAGKLDIVFLSSAAKEGTDFRGTGTMILLEPLRNLGCEEQAYGRAARLRSHANGHKDTVTYYKVVGRFPPVLCKGVAAAEAATAAVSKEHMVDLQADFADLFRRKGIAAEHWTPRAVMGALAHMVALAGGQTVHERMEAANALKREQVDMLLREALHPASIPMPTGALSATGRVTTVAGGAILTSAALQHAASAAGSAPTTLPHTATSETETKETPLPPLPEDLARLLHSRVATLRKHMKPLWQQWGAAATDSSSARIGQPITPSRFTRLVSKALERVLRAAPEWTDIAPAKAAAHPRFQGLVHAQVQRYVTRTEHDKRGGRAPEKARSSRRTSRPPGVDPAAAVASKVKASGPTRRVPVAQDVGAGAGAGAGADTPSGTAEAETETRAPTKTKSKSKTKARVTARAIPPAAKSRNTKNTASTVLRGRQARGMARGDTPSSSRDTGSAEPAHDSVRRSRRLATPRKTKEVSFLEPM